MSKYFIYVPGCDDSTKVLMDLTEEEAAVVRKVAVAVTALGGGCAPSMAIASEAEGHNAWPDYEPEVTWEVPA
jgi:hypothetical protein